MSDLHQCTHLQVPPATTVQDIDSVSDTEESETIATVTATVRESNSDSENEATAGSQHFDHAPLNAHSHSGCAGLLIRHPKLSPFRDHPDHAPAETAPHRSLNGLSFGWRAISNKITSVRHCSE